MIKLPEATAVTHDPRCAAIWRIASCSTRASRTTAAAAASSIAHHDGVRTRLRATRSARAQSLLAASGARDACPICYGQARCPPRWVIVGTISSSGLFLSGVFGMAGGMVRDRRALIYFDVATAMILFSIIQLAANGWRRCNGGAMCAGHHLALLRRRRGRLRGPAPRRVHPRQGAGLPAAGAMPFAVEILPRRGGRTSRGAACRSSPASSPPSSSSCPATRAVPRHLLPEEHAHRKTTLATKAVAQSASHVLRLVYFASSTGLRALRLAPSGAGASRLHGGRCSRRTRSSARPTTDSGTGRAFVIYTICIIYLMRAGWLYWQGFYDGAQD